MDLKRWLKMPGHLVLHQLQLCALGLCKSVKAPMLRDTHLHVDMQGILSNICMMSLKKQLKLTKLLALQSCIWLTAICSFITMGSLMALDHPMTYLRLVSLAYIVL